MLALAFLVVALAGCNATTEAPNNRENETEYYQIVSETQELLDTVADDIYSYWYDSVYNDKVLLLEL